MSKHKNSDRGPQFVRYFGPVLDALRNLGGSGTPDEVVEQVARDQRITEDVQNDTLPSGQSRYRNQVAWARFYLVREGLLDSSTRGVWSLTDQGRNTKLPPEAAYQVFQRWSKFFRSNRSAKSAQVAPGLSIADEEVEAPSHRERLINILRELPPNGFERLSQRLLREAGFTQVVVTGQSGDGGIDGHGILQINPLVSLKVLFQCKRYAGSVTPSHVRDFRGAMAGRADKGIILTTGTFSAEARREAVRDGANPIEVIDGERLLDMLEKLQLGVRPVQIYEVDERFFQEFEKKAE